MGMNFKFRECAHNIVESSDFGFLELVFKVLL